MEYCPGGDLYAAIKKGDLEPAEINSYFKQIIAGISYLHSMGVAHRDIKPENLLIDAKGHVKITDFGVSDVFRMCWEKKTHLSKGLCGSEPYIAPEQFEQKGELACSSKCSDLSHAMLTLLVRVRAEYDARLVDVWAAAVVFYCMHFQELPWRVAKPSDPSFGPYLQLYSTSSSTPPPLSNLVPRECRSIIRRMLDPDPKTRATTETILNDPWFNRIEVIPPLEGILPPVPTLP
jgi:serine/threonine protein kinase